MKVRDCFLTARKDEERGKKHKGLLIIDKDESKAKEYIKKAKDSLEMCDLFKEKRFDYKIPEEWFYSMYYCALAILAKFGVESRSQRCTALFLRYIKDKGVIDIDDDFVDGITVHKEKEEKSYVDDREEARYGTYVKNDDIIGKYDMMNNVCKKIISKTEDIIYSDSKFDIPQELIK